jgi:hypothetical protein
LWNDKIQFKNVLGCSESNENWEFPILEHGIFDGNNAKPEEVDRVVIRRIGKREMAYCGLVTHLVCTTIFLRKEVGIWAVADCCRMLPSRRILRRAKTTMLFARRRYVAIGFSKVRSAGLDYVL